MKYWLRNWDCGGWKNMKTTTWMTHSVVKMAATIPMRRRKKGQRGL